MGGCSQGGQRRAGSAIGDAGRGWMDDSDESFVPRPWQATEITQNLGDHGLRREMAVDQAERGAK